jgi:hypothetical protein
LHFGEPLHLANTSPDRETAELAELDRALEAAQSNATQRVC